MFRFAVCIFFIAITLKESQESLEEITNNNDKSTPLSTDATEKNVEAIKNSTLDLNTNKEDTTVSNDVIINTTKETDDDTKTETTTFTDEDSKETLKGIKDNADYKTEKDPREVYPFNNEKLNAFGIRGNLEALLDTRRRNEFGINRDDELQPKAGAVVGEPLQLLPRPFLSRLPGSWVLPAINARRTIGNGLLKTHRGVLGVGYGAFETGGGLINFLRDSSSSVFRG